MKKMPIFEVFISFLSCYLAVVLFTNDSFFQSNPISFQKLANLASELTVGIIFLVAAFTKIFGVVFNVRWLRVVGLSMSAIIYVSIATTYYLSHALWGLGMFSLLAIFCIISIIDVRYTKL